MLELAARAAGYEIDAAFDDCPIIFSATEPPRDWAPHLDDGDSKRLAVALRISVKMLEDCVAAEWYNDGGVYHCAAFADYDGNEDKAWRYAVLSVAAQIGAHMP